MTSDLNLNIHGFTMLRSQELPEIDGRAYELLHAHSKAKLLYLRNDDPNKAFSIAFRTLPKDSTGVFHILEHSVLCGSDKFPVKEPFVNLLKTSMQTFLNAMTFPDKTMYPVSSTNMRDLLNLMDVYLDAVMHPAIYRKPETFEQEGWHVELDEEGHAFYNGVVYNEMKGVMSDPQSVLFNLSCQALFPDTAYGFESGGDPDAIPSLSYEEFLAEHARHYRFDNSYIILYGNLDIELALSWLDREYLGPIGPGSGEGPREFALQAPVRNMEAVTRMATAPQNACCALSYMVGTAHDRQRIMAADILTDALAGSNEAPLKRALLDAGIADDISVSLADSMLQPFAIIEFRGARGDCAAKAEDAVREALERILEKGIPKDIILGALSHAEFVMREHDFGYSDGVIIAMSAMSGWLYDDSLACAYVAYQDAIAALRDLAQTDYFDELAKQIFLENGHMALAQVIPDEKAAGKGDGGVEELNAGIDDAQRAGISTQLASLRAAQERQDTPEELATLPQLRISDLEEAPIRPSMNIVSKQGLSCLEHEVSTHGICYITRYYRMGGLAFGDLPYLSLLAGILGKVATETRSASQIDTFVQCNLGSLSFAIGTYGLAEDPDAVYPCFSVAASALQENVGAMLDITQDILHATRFDDRERIRSILIQQRVLMEQDFVNNGHRFALQRVGSYCRRADVAAEYLSGVDFYLFLKDLIDDFDARYDSLIAKLEELSALVFSESSCLLSLAGPKAARDSYLAQWEESGIPQACKTTAPASLTTPDPIRRNEAFCIPGDVVFVASGYDRRLIPEISRTAYNGAWAVATRAASFDYLWNEVRVKGGAYGVGLQTMRMSSSRFYSYRDPNIAQTIARFRECANWLRTLDLSEDELEGFIVSTVASIDAPVKPLLEIKRQTATYFAGESQDSYLRDRAEILAFDHGQIAAYAKVIESVMAQDARCVFGSPKIIAESGGDFQIVKLLGE